MSMTLVSFAYLGGCSTADAKWFFPFLCNFLFERERDFFVWVFWGGGARMEIRVVSRRVGLEIGIVKKVLGSFFSFTSLPFSPSLFLAF